jgi:GNAT superfamily N-acetyltransferase
MEAVTEVQGKRGGTIVIRQSSSPEDLDAVRRLMRSFIAWHYERHESDRDLIDQYFDRRSFEEELAGLPGKYAPPSGRLLLAFDGPREAGCVALQDLGDGVCEMKRMFVDPGFQARGVGRELATAVIGAAREIGYRLMRLDTGPRQREAQSLYERLGFQRIDCYYETDHRMRDWLVFMQLEL